jgi:DNA-binding PucR family transcriptional regulator
VRYDGVYDTDLMHTLALVAEAGEDADAAAAELGVPAHRVRYRLDKVRELTGLDAGVEAERRRLAVGVRCWRVLAPALPG